MVAATMNLQAIDWRAPPGVRAMFTTRAGGISAAPLDSLNLAQHVGDSPAAVVENRRRLRLAAELPSEPRWLRQVHGIEVADLDVLPLAEVPQADASVTSRPGTICAVLTADCLPVLLASADGLIVGAAHAGWRGLAAGVLEAVVAAARARTPRGVGLTFWLGPAISARHFEVQADVRDAFVASEPQDATAFAPGRPGHWQCDLPRLARRRLTALGVADGGGGNRCSYGEDTDFYSHRRDVQHRGLATTGRFATLIWRQE